MHSSGKRIVRCSGNPGVSAQRGVCQGVSARGISTQGVSARAVVDLHSKILDARPPWGPKFFQFHAVFGKIRQNRMLAPPPGELAPPPRENPGSATGGGVCQGVSALGMSTWGVSVRGCLPGGLSAKGGVCQGVSAPMHAGIDPPVNRMIDRCKNITFPQLRCGQ